MRFKEYYLCEDKNEIIKLKKELRDVEDWFMNAPSYLRLDNVKRDEKEKQASLLRRRLFQLTGDPYGRTEKEKIKPKSPPRGLKAKYESPFDVPLVVYKWILTHESLLNSDATDAVRWSRIINTRDDERYPSGKMTIYRAVDNSSYDEIREGDWVTTDEDYAIDHNERYFNGNGNILSMDVDGRDVLVSPTGNSEEAIYAPLEYSIDVEGL